MSHRKRGLRALGLTLVCALGLVALMVAGAQAQTNGYLVAGAFITANQTVSTEKHSEHITLLVPGLSLELLCNRLAGEGLELLPGESAENGGKVKLSECATLVKGVESKGCVAQKQPIEMGGNGHLILHKKRVYVLFEPKIGEPFTIIKFNEETCTLPPENKLTGSLVAECLQLNASKVLEEKDCATDEVIHILRQAPQALFNGQEEEGITLPKDILFFGKNPTTVDGTAKVALSGPNTGETFSGMF